MDKGLVQGTPHRPQRALEFMLYLTRLVHAFDMRLTVEGLEHRGLIEAALILGADHGQGYAIARPMPIQSVPEWGRGFRYEMDPCRPRTALGALATYLLWDMQATAEPVTHGADAAFDARQTMEFFIEERGLQSSELARLLVEHFSAGRHARARVRARVIEQFTAVWAQEMRVDAPRPH